MRNKTQKYLKEGISKMETRNKTNIRDIYKGINKFKGY
jgi:hypothetical protein